MSRYIPVTPCKGLGPIDEYTKLSTSKTHLRRTPLETDTDTYTDTETQRHRDPETPTHRHTDTHDTQTHRDAETQRHRHTDTQSNRKPCWQQQNWLTHSDGCPVTHQTLVRPKTFSSESRAHTRTHTPPKRGEKRECSALRARPCEVGIYETERLRCGWFPSAQHHILVSALSTMTELMLLSLRELCVQLMKKSADVIQAHLYGIDECCWSEPTPKQVEDSSSRMP